MLGTTYQNIEFEKDRTGEIIESENSSNILTLRHRWLNLDVELASDKMGRVTARTKMTDSELGLDYRNSCGDEVYLSAVFYSRISNILRSIKSKSDTENPECNVPSPFSSPSLRSKFLQYLSEYVPVFDPQFAYATITQLYEISNEIQKWLHSGFSTRVIWSLLSRNHSVKSGKYYTVFKILCDQIRGVLEGSRYIKLKLKISNKDRSNS